MTNAATYRRSSKDRSDVSIDAQGRALDELAAARHATIVEQFVDVVESGSSEDRAGFMELLAAIKNLKRGWTVLFVYDTSRIARRRHIAQAFKHECRKRGVGIIYAQLPADLDPITEVVLESSFEAMDEVHSLMSREKGLMGMRENVRKGFRAGGRAPMGYVLERHATGAIRDGKPVTKSKLVPNESAPRMRAYLKARAAGQPRALLVRELGFKCNSSSLIGVEWNALTYAGHTVWNVHREVGAGSKRRPRDEWTVQRDTHPALITDAEAETILAQLTSSTIGRAVSKAKTAMSSYLLTGLLVTSDGRQWTGKGGRFYKLRAAGGRRGRLVKCEIIDRAVLAQFSDDLRSDEFLERLIEAGRAAGLDDDPAKPLRDRIRALEREKARAAELALASDDAGTTFTELVGQRSRQIAALRAELTAIEADSALAEAVRKLTPARLRELMMETAGPDGALPSLVDRVLLEPDLTCQIHYKGLSVASPRLIEGWAPLVCSSVRVA